MRGRTQPNRAILLQLQSLTSLLLPYLYRKPAMWIALVMWTSPVDELASQRFRRVRLMGDDLPGKIPQCVLNKRLHAINEFVPLLASVEAIPTGFIHPWCAECNAGQQQCSIQKAFYLFSDGDREFLCSCMCKEVRM